MFLIGPPSLNTKFTIDVPEKALLPIDTILPGITKEPVEPSFTLVLENALFSIISSPSLKSTVDNLLQSEKA